ncbi:MAG: coenzyme F420-0:L-glutamate ligase [Marinilabiliales bacterium]|nr:coenzyme F420-0:L-glutamate ligase [Marinilabiliales bacterium]
MASHLVRQGDNLADIIVKSLNETNIQLQDGDILVIAQKIVSKADGADGEPGRPSRHQYGAINLAEQIQKDARAVELILRESNEVVRTRTGTIIVEHRLGFICASAGIDHSNVAGEGDSVEEWILLLPQDPDLSAGGCGMRSDPESGNKSASSLSTRMGAPGAMERSEWRSGLRGFPPSRTCAAKRTCSASHCASRRSALPTNLRPPRRWSWRQAAEGTPVVHVRGFLIRFAMAP